MRSEAKLADLLETYLIRAAPCIAAIPLHRTPRIPRVLRVDRWREVSLALPALGKVASKRTKLSVAVGIEVGLRLRG